MPPERLVLPPGLTSQAILGDGDLVLDAASAHHLGQVLRMRKGEELWVGDGLGTTRQGALREIGRRELTLEWVSDPVYEDRLRPEIVLCLAMIDAGDLRRAVEGAVEAGADRIVLFRSQYSNRPTPDEGGALWEKLLKNIRSSSEQARRAWLPNLESSTDILGYAGGLSHVFAAHGGDGIPNFSTACTPVDSSTNTLGVLIGPEGGWSEGELADFRRSALTLAHLGGTVLRARTAAPVAVSHLQLARCAAGEGSRGLD